MNSSLPLALRVGILLAILVQPFSVQVFRRGPLALNTSPHLSEDSQRICLRRPCAKLQCSPFGGLLSQVPVQSPSLPSGKRRRPISTPFQDSVQREVTVGVTPQAVTSALDLVRAEEDHISHKATGYRGVLHPRWYSHAQKYSSLRRGDFLVSRKPTSGRGSSSLPHPSLRTISPSPVIQR